MRSTSNALQNGSWTNHHQPEGARLIPSVPGIVFNTDRLLFLLQDGRLAELHIHGLGGVRMGPISRTTTGKKQEAGNYVWSIIDAPESEGGNAEYCSPNPGPLNCLEGTNDEFSFLNPVNHHQETFTGKSLTKPWQGTTRSLFQIRTLQFGKSIFFLGKDGVPSERFFNNNGWLWLKHEYSGPPINGILAIYNGTVFMNDEDGNMLLREWHGDKLHWFNSSSLQGGEKVSSGSPSDGLLGEVRTVTLEDAQFFVSQSGDLLEFMVAMRNFSWKNCGHPPETSVSAIIDQENLRYRVIFVVGSNGKLYQFNRITRHWFSEFNQPKHLNLSRIPGAVYRPSFHSTSGSLLMRSQNGNLVEFGWDPAFAGWFWSNHGFPGEYIHLATSPGPCMGNGNILAVGSDGRVYARQMIDDYKWRWKDFGHPLYEQTQNNVFVLEEKSKTGKVDLFVSFEGECNTLIDSVRPVAMDRDMAVFVLRDGRLAELKKEEDRWEWVSIIDTPTSSCHSNYWTTEGS